MNPEILSKYQQAGKLAAESLQYGGSLIKKGVSWLETTEKIEKKIVELGGGLAWPPQMSLNAVAAHDYPAHDDKTILEDQVICLDVGVHIDGYVGDNALTVDLSGQNTELVTASRTAVNEVIKTIQIGTSLGDIGKTIQETIQSFGFEPVKNLSGHGLAQFDVHTPPTVPNFASGDETTLEKGMVIAIEPFASTGAGMIYEKGEARVFSQLQKKPVRTGFVRNILKQIESYQMLPFAKKWLVNNFSEAQVNYALKQLEQLGIVKGYPPLVDKNNGLVSQAEHTFIIDDKVEITTKQ